MEKSKNSIPLHKIESTLENTEDSIVIIEPFPTLLQGRRILYVNQAFTAITGYTAPEALNNTLRMLRGPNTNEQELTKIRASLEHCSPVKSRFINYKKDGSEVWIDSSFVPYVDEEGKLVYWISVQTDITDQVIAEEKLKKNNEIQQVLNEILRISLDPLSQKEQLKRILDTILSIPWLSLQNKGCIYLTEDDSDILVMKVQSNLSVYLLNQCKRVPFGRCLCGKAAIQREIVYKEAIDEFHEFTYEDMTPHGHYCVPIKSGDKVWGVLTLYIKAGHSRDSDEVEFLSAVANTLAGILERKQVEEALKKNEEQFRSVVETANDAIISFDSKGSIIFWNTAAEEIFGYSLGEIKGRSVSLLIPDIFHSDRFGKKSSSPKIENHGNVGKTMEYRGYRKGASGIPIELSLSAWGKSDDLHFTAVIRDISERKETEQKLIHSEKMASIGRLAAGIAHEINNPMSNASLSVQRLLRGIERDRQDIKTTKRVLESVKLDIDRASNIARELLFFSYPGETEYIDLSMNEIIQKSIALVRRKEMDFLDMDLSDVSNIMGDPLKLQQLMINILSNACEAVTAGGRINISSFNEGNFVVVTVSDTGKGIDKENLPKVFDPFFTTKDVGDGIGLGLSICYGIIKQHNGNIKIDSIIGEGTTLTIKLPSFL